MKPENSFHVCITVVVLKKYPTWTEFGTPEPSVSGRQPIKNTENIYCHEKTNTKPNLKMYQYLNIYKQIKFSMTI